jgi:hypothetical protein
VVHIPDDVAADLAHALIRARTSIPPAWIKREGGRLDAAVAFQGVYELATKAGLIPEPRSRRSATVHPFPALERVERQDKPAAGALPCRDDAPGDVPPPA